MKMFNGQVEKKQWAIALTQDDDSVSVAAVNPSTGDMIAYLITFQEDGGVVSDSGASDVLSEEGYDPHLYDNEWDSEGRLVIRKDTL